MQETPKERDVVFTVEARKGTFVLRKTFSDEGEGVGYVEANAWAYDSICLIGPDGLIWHQRDRA